MFYDWKEVEEAHVLHLLIQLQELFSNQENWIYWPKAQDTNGLEVRPTDSKAVKFCLMGACEHFCEKDHAKPLADYIDCATREFLNDLSSNNELLHGKCDYAEEMALISIAIEELSKNEKSTT